uniref:Uncharacterized protein n=1 Tax=Alexandrium catenella TaxID=2925 RepID=A0A7S1SB44_ALECA
MLREGQSPEEFEKLTGECQVGSTGSLCKDLRDIWCPDPVEEMKLKPRAQLVRKRVRERKQQVMTQRLYLTGLLLWNLAAYWLSPRVSIFCIGVSCVLKLLWDVTGSLDKIWKYDDEFEENIKAKAGRNELEADDLRPIVQAENRYQDFSDGGTYIAVFVGQVAMMCFLVYYLWSEEDTPRDGYKTVQKLYCALSICVQVIASSQTGASFYDEIPFWAEVHRMWKDDIFDKATNEYRLVVPNSDTGETMIRSERSDGIAGFFPLEWYDLWGRVGASLLVNSVFQHALVLAVPLFLLRIESCFDFVKDAVAVLYVVDVDQLPAPKQFRQIFDKARHKRSRYAQDDPDRKGEESAGRGCTSFWPLAVSRA